MVHVDRLKAYVGMENESSSLKVESSEQLSLQGVDQYVTVQNLDCSSHGGPISSKAGTARSSVEEKKPLYSKYGRRLKAPKE